MSKKYEANIYIGDSLVQIVADPGEPIKFTTLTNLNGDELTAAHIIKEVFSCLLAGKSLDSHFNPFDNSDDDIVIVKCKWERNGNLSFIGETKDKHLHAISVQDALDRKRIFTCSKALYKRIPMRRNGSMVSK